MSEIFISEEEKKHFHKGYAYMQSDLTDEALLEFTKVLEINPSNTWGHIELGKLKRNKQDFFQAEKLLLKALDMPLNREQEEHAHVCLAEVYRLLGKYALAEEHFKQALTIDPGNKRLRSWKEAADKIKGSRKEIAPYKVFFTWGMHYQCNYRCSYCNTPKPEKDGFCDQKKNCASYLNVEEWVRIWGKIYEKYGPCRIRLDGGEPSSYPSFIDLIEGVSKYHTLQINTNLSFDVGEFVKRIRPERVRIDVSLHLEYVRPEDFFAKTKLLYDHNFKIVASCVAYPPFLDKINECKRPFEKLKIPFIIHPFSGQFNGKDYPKAYEMDEVSKIYSLDEASRLIMSWRRGESRVTKGKLCRMGQIYARIYPNADVYRCCAEGGLLKIGNLTDEDFKLLEEPLVCTSENCPCWKCMIIDEEQRWTSLWLDDWELPPLRKAEK